MRITLLFHILFSLMSAAAFCQQATITGKVISSTDKNPIEGAKVFLQNTSVSTLTDARGKYTISDIDSGEYDLGVFYYGSKSQLIRITIKSGNNIQNFEMEEIRQVLDEVKIDGNKEQNLGVRRLNGVEGAGIYEAKKNEVILLSNITANLSTNNSRQIYSEVPGLNIWESDGAGLQLGIGARGLDPNRTSNFNVRQNGYDISADALGYPESYYTPPAEAVEKIEVVRGAASLQYGTQFGGLLNFIMKKGPESKPFELTARQTVGSYGFWNTFVSAGGTKQKINYYTFYQHKQGNGWRPNSGFDLNMAYGSLTYTSLQRLSITFQYSFMQYIAQQPGGLTDAYFEENPRQSIRERNWFQVNWNLMAIVLDYKISDNLYVNIRNFGLLGGRDAVGNLQRIDRVDNGGPRDLFVDDFHNFGNETRLLYRYKAFKQPSVLLTGLRFYHGLTDRKQGVGSDSSDADFKFNNPRQPDGSDYDFPGENISVFAENIFNVNEKFSLTPGVRVEYIKTIADGYYQDKVLVPDPETGLAVDSTFYVDEYRDRKRVFLFAGVGLSYKASDDLEWYANFSQNYRSINFNDIRVDNPNLTVDENISDERGFNSDMGIRGSKNSLFNYDVSLFYLQYNDRIGNILKVDDETFRIYRYRTNVADSRHFGFESFGEIDLLKMVKPESSSGLNIFGNLSFIHATYIHTDNPAIKGNMVELVPEWNFKTGISFNHKNFRLSYQYSYTSDQFSDATNAVQTPSAVEGIIPAYQVMDIGLSYAYKWAMVEMGINNLTNEMYFTRRATGYPGPGIIPSDGRAFYLTLSGKF